MSKPHKGKEHTFLQSDRAILLLCICIAALFWLFNKLSKTFYNTCEVKIDYVMPKDKAYLETPPTTLNATFKGRGYDLLSEILNREKRRIRIDNPSRLITANELERLIQEKISSNIEVSDLNIEYIDLKLEDLLEKKVPLVINADLPAELNIRSAILSEDSVVLKGPASVIKTVDRWYTSKLLINKVEQIKQEVSTTHTDSSLVEVLPKNVMVEIEIEAFTEKAFFVPLSIKNGRDSLHYFPEKIKVTCMVGLSQYKDLSADEFVLEVDLKGIALNEENNTVPLQLIQQPSIVKNVNFSPKSVQFYFVKKSEETE